MSNQLLRIHLNSLLFLLLSFNSFLYTGCGSSEATDQLSAGERYALGMKYFNDEDYLEAIEEFKVVSLQFQGTKIADAAQFYLAESRFKREEYILAAFEYDVLIRYYADKPVRITLTFSASNLLLRAIPQIVFGSRLYKKSN